MGTSTSGGGGRQLVTVLAEGAGERLAAARDALDAALTDGSVGHPDAGGMLEVEIRAASHEEALARVRDAIAAAGVDDHFTFPATTGTEYRPPGDRAGAIHPEVPEPPHLERGGAREGEPAPEDPPGQLRREL